MQTCLWKCLGRVQFSVRARALTVQKTLWKLCCVWKSFCSEYQRIHCNTHTGERLHECDTHEKALSTHPSYIQPLTVHSGAKPCECSQCGKVPGATTGDPTHDKGHAEETWEAKVDQDLRDSLDLLEHLPPNQNLPTVYYIMPFTNSSDINRGLSPTTFLWKKST